MNKRHLFYGVVFVAIFSLGSFNIATDGGLSYLANSGEFNVTPEINKKTISP